MATRTPIKPPAPTPPDEFNPEEGHELRMSLLDHLLELRNRVTRAVLALLFGVVIGFAFTEPVFAFC